MKNILIIIFAICCLNLAAQNIFQISFSVGQGNASWQYSNLQLAETNFEGDTVNLYDLNIHATSPTVIANINAGYSFKKIKAGIGFSLQHYFTDVFIADPIYFEESEFYAPITFSTYNDPQPTYFKFYPYIEYAFVKQDNFELYAGVNGGTFLTHSMTEDSLEGFHWFINISSGVNYNLNDKFTFSFAPTFDYSKVNFDFFDDPVRKNPFLNIYSFYFSAGIKYNFID